MSRKGLLKLVIAIACLTVVMGVYTVLALVLTGPKVVDYKVVLLDGQTTTFVKGKLSMSGDTDSLTYDAEKKVYVASNPNENAVGTVKKVEATVQKRYGKIANYHIEIHRVGNGTVADPYNLNNADVLMERFAEEGAAGNSYALVNDIDLKDKEYKPLGDTNAKFSGVFTGNGHTVSNMKIVVTNANLDSYVDDYTVGIEARHSARIGFFGYTMGAVITNMNLVDYEIYVEKDVNIPYERTVEDVTETINLRYFTVGGLIGTADSTVVTGAEAGSKVSGKITAKSWYDVSMYGGVAGIALATDIENYNADLTLVSSNSGDYLGGIAGLVGSLSDTEVPVIKNCKVTVNAELDLSGLNSTRLAGVVAKSTDLVCENVTVENFNVKRLAGTEANKEKTNLDTISGAFDFVNAYDTCGSTIKNVQVKNVNVDLLADATVCGFAHTIEKNVIIINSSVSGENTMAGYLASGFVRVNMGDIKYNADFTGEYAVKADIKGYQRAAGFVLENYGKIVNEAENKQKVEVVVTYAGSAHFRTISPSNEAEYNATSNARGIAGFAHSMQTAGAEISGFSVKADMKDGINMAGLVAYLGVHKVVVGTDTLAVKYEIANSISTDPNVADAYVTADTIAAEAAGSVLRNCDVEVKYYTFQYTKHVGGAVVELADGTTIENVNVKMTMKNEDANTNNGKSYAGFVGGVVARVSGSGATIANCEVKDSVIEVGDSAQIVEVDKVPTYKWNAIGGVVGIVRNAVEGSHNYFVDDITINACKVTNLVIRDTVDLTNFQVEKNEDFKVTDGVAGFVGVAQSISGNLSGEITGLEIYLTETLNTKCPASLKIASRLASIVVDNINATASSNKISTNL